MTVALTGATIVAEGAELSGHALLIDDGMIAGVVPEAELPAVMVREVLDGGYLLPGFIDTQVNGGSDVLFNDQPTRDGLRAIARAHRRFGTTGMLPTLISDDLSVVEAAMAAIDAAVAGGEAGILGIHIEGPFLNADRRGIHDASKFRRLDEAAIHLLSRPSPGVRLVTIAPELAPPGAIRALTQAGVIVAAGHSTATFEQTQAALAEGLAGFTHLFNAMTPLSSRAPGMVGAALLDHGSRFGLIVDGHHVHPAALRVALAARGLEGAMLVTDAMPPVGGSGADFALMGRRIRVDGGVLRGEDGTLAGSALTMAQAVRNTCAWLGCSLVDASMLASGNPAAFLRDAMRGVIRRGAVADLVHLDAGLRVTRTWIGGTMSEASE